MLKAAAAARRSPRLAPKVTRKALIRSELEIEELGHLPEGQDRAGDQGCADERPADVGPPRDRERREGCLRRVPENPGLDELLGVGQGEHDKEAERIEEDVVRVQEVALPAHAVIEEQVEFAQSRRRDGTKAV